MTEILASLGRLQNVQNLLDVALVSLVFYILLRFFRGTQAVQLLRGILLIALATAIISQISGFTAFNWLLTQSMNVILVAIPVIFQPELRRALERVGRTAPLLVRRIDNAGIQSVINEVTKATEQLAQRRHGALIVFEGATGLGEITTRGVALNAEVTAALITTVFFPNTALHDGAMVIRGERVVAASCVLPLTEQELADSQMGTRHRAALGVTEQTDALTIVVSEETGTISVAQNGRILRIEPNVLRNILSKFYRT
ncbi:MAG: diadenylate cyclase CdaA [Caldilineaceae bacterium]